MKEQRVIGNKEGNTKIKINLELDFVGSITEQEQVLSNVLDALLHEVNTKGLVSEKEDAYTAKITGELIEGHSPLSSEVSNPYQIIGDKLFPEVINVYQNDFTPGETPLTEEDFRNITIRICEERPEDAIDFYVPLSDIESLDDNDDWSDVNNGISNMIKKYAAEKLASWLHSESESYFSRHITEGYLGDDVPKYHVLQNPDGAGWVIGQFYGFVGEYVPLEEEGEERQTFSTAEEAMNYVESTLEKEQKLFLYQVEGIGELKDKNLGSFSERYRNLHVAASEEDAITQAEKMMNEKGYSFQGRAISVPIIDGHNISVK